MVEKYEQMLSQDPASTVFVELARAYLDKGENEKAIEVCRSGCTHHPASVAGRVLWGKALINAGKAAEAMQQFDAAVNIDKENPHAYNLISEVLLRKGLYRSALPILRKASALQPNDGRIKQWLEQARTALSGGPAPVLYDETSVSTQALSPEPKTDAAAAAAPPAPPAPSAPQPAPAPPKASGPRAARASAPTPAPPAPVSSPSGEFPNADPDVFAAFTPAKADPRAEPTVLMSAYTPAATDGRPTLEVPTQTGQIPGAWPSAPRPMDHKPGPPVPTTEMPAVLAQARAEDFRPTMEIPAPPPGPATGELPMVVGTLEDRTSTAELPLAQGAVAEAPDPFTALMGGRTESTETFRGLTSTFQALEEAEAAPLPVPLGPPPGPPVPSQPEVPSVIPSDELKLPASSSAEIPAASGGGLLDEVVSAQSEMPTSEFQLPGMKPAPEAPRAAPPRSSGGLLDEIPDESLEPPSANVEAPRVEFSTQATEAIAKEYERELREKLKARQQEKTFFQKHGLKVGLAVGLVVVVVALAGSFLATRQRHGGESLDGALSKGKAAINADTKEQYGLSLQSLDLALSMDETNVDAFAYQALARAFLYAEHGGALADREAARKALDQPKVREAHPAIVTVVEYLVADAAELTGRKQQLLGSDGSSSLVEAQAGRVLLAEKKLDEAFKHLEKATQLDSRNLRALVGLGEYYLASEDYESASNILSTAETLSRFHPQRVMGLAEAR
ncbi:MAG: tetratricopeptide repeat protein, partial [Myxococcaceae bacterium]|nr:tetratricopeptide repeat protein [Myxococcaceae bacterium]